jgi:hypothetical protein
MRIKTTFKALRRIGIAFHRKGVEYAPAIRHDLGQVALVNGENKVMRTA